MQQRALTLESGSLQLTADLCSLTQPQAFERVSPLSHGYLWNEQLFMYYPALVVLVLRATWP